MQVTALHRQLCESCNTEREGSFTVNAMRLASRAACKGVACTQTSFLPRLASDSACSIPVHQMSVHGIDRRYHTLKTDSQMRCGLQRHYLHPGLLLAPLGIRQCLQHRSDATLTHASAVFDIVHSLKPQSKLQKDRPAGLVCAVVPLGGHSRAETSH